MTARDLRSAELLDAAVELAQRWPVIPLHTPGRWGLCSCDPEDSEPCSRPGKHPRFSIWQRTTAPGRLQVATAWWTDLWPDANIGLACGVHLQALDVDGEAGRETLQTLERRHGRLPEGGPQVRTGSGGLQVYFSCGGGALRTRVGFLPGLDWRGTSDLGGQGSLVVAPPSLHRSGRRYEWLEGCGPDRPLPAVPDWLATAVTPPQPTRPATRRPAGATRGYAEAALRGEYDRVYGASGGERNTTLNRAAFALGQLVADGRLSADRVESNLLYAAMSVGLSKGEAWRTIRSGMQAGAKKPRGA